MPLRRRPRAPRRGARETIQADAPALGLALLAAGVGVWLAVVSHPEAKAIGTALLVVGVLVLTSRWFGFPIRALRPEPADPASGGDPDDHLPWVAPTKYQVRQIRQAVAKMKEAGVSEFGLFDLDGMLRSLRRKRTDPVYEPLHGANCQPGVDQMVANGELTPTNRGYQIP
jgi:hypothetical protein